MTSLGLVYLQIHFSKNVLATVSAVLSGMAASSTIFDHASVMTMTYLLPSSDVLSGPNKSIWTRSFFPSLVPDRT